MRFADDTTLLCQTKDDMMDLLKKVEELSREKGLLLNAKKTKIMVIDKNRNDFTPFTLNGQNLEEVKEFIYLGSLINNKADCMQEVKRRINIARTSMHKMDTIWKSRKVSKKIKL